MKDSYDVKNDNSKSASYHTIKVTGKDQQIWKERKEGFWLVIQRKFSELFDNEFLRKRKNSFPEEALDNISESAMALAKKPQLVNAEMHASVKVSLSEAKKNNAQAALMEAKARFTNAQASLIEEQAKKIQLLESEKAIEALIKKGTLVPISRDGKTYLIYRMEK